MWHQVYMVKKKKTNFNMKYIYAILVVIAVILVAYFLVPVAFLLMRVLIGLGILAVFGAGVWIALKFNKNKNEKS